MIVIKFGKWSSASLRRFTYKRIYTKKYNWTPFCVIKKRFKCETSLQTANEHLIDKDIMDALCYLRSLALIPAASEEAVLGSFKQVHDYIKALEQKLQVELSDECVSKEMQFGRYVVRPGQLEGYLGRTTVVVEKEEKE